MRYALGISAVLVHLVLVGFGAADAVPVSEDHLTGRLIETYRAFTGADNGYGFFAPGVAAERRVVLHVFNGRDWLDVDEGFAGRESSFRLTTMTGLFGEEVLREPLAASWAARALGAVPGASVVLVEVEVYWIPRMAEYRRGERPRWITECIFPFTRYHDGMAPGAAS